jgi:GDP-4-dehydro-6-deoxy-D-mannose reductase
VAVRVLITGVTGFAGSHLAEFITTRHPDVVLYGTYRWRSRLDNLDDLAAAGSLEVIEGQVDAASVRGSEREGRLALLECDLTDPFAIALVVAAVQPDRVFHLAAQSFVPASFAEPGATLATNVLGELHLLEALRAHAPRSRVLVAGSSEEYGAVRPEELPVRETNELRPLSPYAVSKVAQDRLGWQYHRSHGLHVVITRAFNHTGPRRGEVFAESNFARQIAEIELERRPGVIRVGDLSSQRDWHDVRDTASAYWLALEAGTAGESYNVGSGIRRSVRDVLDSLLALSRGTQATVEQDPARLRPSDVPILYADATKFRERTGWAPAIPWERTLADLLNWWRARLRKR